MTTLLPCPFCGKEPRQQMVHLDGDERTERYLGVSCPNHTDWITLEQWNRRALHEPATEAVLSINDPNAPTTSGIQIIEALSRDEILEEAAGVCDSLQDHGINVPFRELCATAIRALAGKGASQEPNIMVHESDVAYVGPEPLSEFVRVPREPTEAQIDAMRACVTEDGETCNDSGYRAFYRAMIAHAPQSKP